MNRFVKLFFVLSTLALPAMARQVDQSRQAPSNLAKFQPILSECRLQCPSTKKSIRPLVNYTSSHFYLVEQSSMLINMERGDGNRCELRHNQEWSSAGTSHRYKALLRIDPGDDLGFTFMQIHSKNFKGTDGIRYPEGPLLMVGRNYKGKTNDHLWASVRTSLEPKKGKRFDLGARPDGFFDFEVSVDNSILIIKVNGETKVEQDFHHADVLPRNYFKTGVYLHKGTGPHNIYYERLEMGSFDSETDSSIIVPYVEEEPVTISPPKSQEKPVTVPSPKSEEESVTVGPPKSTKPASISTPKPPSKSVKAPPETSTTNQALDARVSKFVLVNTETNQNLFDLVDGQTLDLNRLPPFSVRAQVAGHDEVSRVSFEVDSREIRRDHSPPYLIAGDSPRRGYERWTPSVGRHTITATAYVQQGNAGMKGGSLTIEIEVIQSTVVVMNEPTPASPTVPFTQGIDVPVVMVDHSNTAAPTMPPTLSTALPTIAPYTAQPSLPLTDSQRVTHLMLVDVDSGDDLFALQDGDIVDTSLLPHFSIRAQTYPEVVGSVQFVVNDEEIRIESFPPYAIAGDQQRTVFYSWKVGTGEYTIKAIPYTKMKRKGVPGEALSVTIQVV